jgi:hypothetical protein
MANRHKVQKGGVGSTPVSYGNPKVVSEARERKRGGRAGGGKVDGGAVAAGRMDKRARGGRTGGGSDKSPFSSAGAGMRTWNPGKGG